MTTVKFNGTNLSKLFIIGNQSRPLPEFRDASSTVDGRDGDIFESLTVGPREVSFELVCKGKSPKEIQDAARTLMDLFTVRKPRPLTFSDEVDDDGNQLVRYAVPTGSFDSQEFIRAGRWRCRFRQHDPFLYGRERSVVVKAGQAKKVDAGGNTPAWPTASAVVASGTEYRLGLAGGKYVKYAAAFSGQEMNIDMSAQTAKPKPAISGADGLQKGSRFFSIDGTVTFEASHTTTVSWRERWL